MNSFNHLCSTQNMIIDLIEEIDKMTCNINDIFNSKSLENKKLFIELFVNYVNKCRKVLNEQHDRIEYILEDEYNFSRNKKENHDLNNMQLNKFITDVKEENKKEEGKENEIENKKEVHNSNILNKLIKKIY